MNCTSMMFTTSLQLAAKGVLAVESYLQTQFFVLHPFYSVSFLLWDSEIEQHVFTIVPLTVFSPVYQHFSAQAQTNSPHVQVSQSHWSVEMSKFEGSSQMLDRLCQRICSKITKNSHEINSVHDLPLLSKILIKLKSLYLTTCFSISFPSYIKPAHALT